MENKKIWLGMILTALAVYAAAEGMITTQSGDLTLSPASGNVVVDGKVGVGTNAPTVKLDVHAGSVSPNWVRYTPSGPVMFVSTTENAINRDTLNGREPVLTLVRSGVPGLIYSNVAEFLLSKASKGGGANTRLDIRLNNYYDDAYTDVLSLSGNGNVGVGTTDPKDKLHVAGGVTAQTFIGDRTAAGANSYLALRNSGGANTVLLDAKGSSYFNGGNVGVGTTNPSSGLLQLSGSHAKTLLYIEQDNTANKAMLLYGPAATDNAVSVVDMYANNGVIPGIHLKQSGNVGIGTSNPGYKLDVGGTLMVRDDYIYANDADNSHGVYLRHNGNIGFIQSAQHGKAFTDTAINPSGGNVGIGTNSPSEKLDVAGNIKASGKIKLRRPDGGYACCGPDNSNEWVCGSC